MAEIHSHTGVVRYVPDDLTVAQFILDSHHHAKPVRKEGTPWIIDDSTGKKIGLDELRARTYGLANALSGRYGIKEDDVVLIFSPNHVDYLVAVWAAHRLGAIMSGANPSYTAGELSSQILQSNASVIFADPTSLQTVLGAAQLADMSTARIILFNTSDSLGDNGPKSFFTIQDLVSEGLKSLPNFQERKLASGEAKTKLAFLPFSSGTTGRPKAVAISHYSAIANLIQIATHHKVNEDYCPWEDVRFRPGDVILAGLPLYHIYGFVFNAHFPLFCGMSIVIVSKFNFLEFLKNIVKYQITHLMLVPPQVVLLSKREIATDFDFSCVRYVTIGAAPLSPELMHRLTELFPNAAIGQSYGATETSCLVTTFSIDEKRSTNGSVGVLVPGVVARVIREDGALAGVDEPGELVVQSLSIASGYFGNEDASKENFRDGWYYTGDQVRVDKNGEVFILDRLREMIKVKGFQVAPAELEGCLLDHPDVADCCVVGKPDEYSGELPIAFVVLQPIALARIQDKADEAEAMKRSIMQHVIDNKAPFKRLAGGVQFLDSIPKNPSGKLLRRLMRDMARQLSAEA